MKKYSYIIFSFLLLPYYAVSQSTVSLDLFPLGFHVDDRRRYLMFENRVDFNGNLVVEPGAVLTFEFFTKETKRSIQLQQGFFSDAGAQWSGWTQFAFRAKIFHWYKSKISLAAGPALVYRNSWYCLDGYEDNPEDGYNLNGKVEFRWAIPVQLQYNYYTGKRSELNVSVLYHYERHTIFPTIGFKYWISTYVKTKCNDCEDSFKRKKLKDWF